MRWPRNRVCGPAKSRRCWLFVSFCLYGHRREFQEYLTVIGLESWLFVMFSNWYDSDSFASFVRRGRVCCFPVNIKLPNIVTVRSPAY